MPWCAASKVLRMQQGEPFHAQGTALLQRDGAAQPTAHLMDTSASFTHSTMVVLCRCTACVSTPTTLDSVLRATYLMLLSLQGSQQQPVSAHRAVLTLWTNCRLAQ